MTERTLENLIATTHPLEDRPSRRLGQQRGYLFQRGPSWLLTYREYVRGADGKTIAQQRCERIGHSSGPGTAE